MAEFLVRAVAHPMDSYTQEQIDALSNECKESFNARGQVGDINAVYDDGVCTEEPDPTSCFIIVKVPQLPRADYAYLATQLVGNKTVSFSEDVEKALWDDETKRTKWITSSQVQETPTVVEKDSTTYTISGSCLKRHLKKVRKYRLPPNWVINKYSQGKRYITITLSEDKLALINSIIEKTS